MHIVSLCVCFGYKPGSCSSCEARGAAAPGVEVHMDGEEHWSGAGSEHTRARNRAAQPLLLLAQKRCMGRAQGNSGEQAMDHSEKDDHSSQSGHRHHQPLATEWWQSVLNLNSILF